MTAGSYNLSTAKMHPSVLRNGVQPDNSSAQAFRFQKSGQGFALINCFGVGQDNEGGGFRQYRRAHIA